MILDLSFPLFDEDELVDFKDDLNFFYVDELKELNERLSLSEKGKKAELVSRILYFCKTGEKINLPKFPKNSCAQSGKVYEIVPESLMLKGAYKNDLKTRIFFKKLIGDYFHFTAFGIDWLNQRWMDGSPPTYQEFADMWQTEQQRRKESPVAPKEEWAYINFVQDFLRQHPNAKRDDINIEWETERQRRKSCVNKMLERFL